MRKSSVDRSRYIKIGVIVVLLIALISVGLILLHQWEASRGEFSEYEENDDVIEHMGKEYVLKQNVETFLILGLDKFEGKTTPRTAPNAKV